MSHIIIYTHTFINIHIHFLKEKESTQPLHWGHFNLMYVSISGEMHCFKEKSTMPAAKHGLVNGFNFLRTPSSQSDKLAGTALAPACSTNAHTFIWRSSKIHHHLFPKPLQLTPPQLRKPLSHVQISKETQPWCSQIQKSKSFSAAGTRRACRVVSGVVGTIW